MAERGERILIVEDEALVAMLIEEMVLELGHEVIGVAASIAEAEEILEERPQPGAAILDVNLCGEFSYPLADRLTERGIPFLFSTGYGRQERMQDYRGCPVLQKPFSIHALDRTLDYLLGDRPVGGGGMRSDVSRHCQAP